MEKPELAYALAQVYQGAVALEKDDICRRVIEMLCDCENFRRPLGTGIVADQMKASLNVLEALWPTLSKTDYGEV